MSKLSHREAELVQELLASSGYRILEELLWKDEKRLREALERPITHDESNLIRGELQAVRRWSRTGVERVIKNSIGGTDE